MTNFEKYKADILAFLNHSEQYGVINGEPVLCCDQNCRACELYDPLKWCDNDRILWLYKEAKAEIGTPKLTPEEYHFIMSLPRYSRIKVRHGECIEISSICAFDMLSFDEVSFVPEFSNLENDLWYDTMEMREREVDE